MRRTIESIEAFYKKSLIDPWGHDWRGSMRVRNFFYRDYVQKIIDKYFKKKKKLVILDIGCGSGVLSSILYDMLIGYFPTLSYLAVDISHEAIRRACMYFPRDFLSFRVIESSILQDIQDGPYDLIIGFEMLAYFHEFEYKTFFSHVKSLLSNEGKVIFSSNIGIEYNDAVYVDKDILERNIRNFFEIIELKDLYLNSYIDMFEQKLLIYGQGGGVIRKLIKSYLSSPLVPGTFNMFFDKWSTLKIPRKRNRVYILK